MCKIHLSLLALEEKIKLPTQANSVVDNQACIVSGFNSILNHCLDLFELKDYRGYLNKAIIPLKIFTNFLKISYMSTVFINFPHSSIPPCLSSAPLKFMACFSSVNIEVCVLACTCTHSSTHMEKYNLSTLLSLRCIFFRADYLILADWRAHR